MGLAQASLDKNTLSPASEIAGPERPIAQEFAVRYITRKIEEWGETTKLSIDVISELLEKNKDNICEALRLKYINILLSEDKIILSNPLFNVIFFDVEQFPDEKYDRKITDTNIGIRIETHDKTHAPPKHLNNSGFIYDSNITLGELKIKLEEYIRTHLAGFANYEFHYFESTKHIINRSGSPGLGMTEETGGWKLVLRTANGKQHTIWLRNSQTEPNVVIIDFNSPDRHILPRLKQLFHLATLDLKCTISKNHEQTSKAAAEYFIKEVRRLIAEKGKAVVCFSAGDTPKGIYRIIREQYKDALDWSKVITFNLDEYIFPEGTNGPINHPDSFRHYMEEELFKHLPIPEENIHFLDGSKFNIEDYKKEIAEAGGIDLCILGLGQNGHIAFNEPGSSFDSSVRQVKLTESTRMDNMKGFENDLDMVPRNALTMGIADIMASGKIMLMATGRSKRQAILKTLYGNIREQVPASILQTHLNVKYFLDRDALDGLKNIIRPETLTQNAARRQRFTRALEEFLKLPTSSLIPERLTKRLEELNKGRKVRIYSFRSIRALEKFCRWGYRLRFIAPDDIIIIRTQFSISTFSELSIRALRFRDLREEMAKEKKQKGPTLNIIEWEKTFFTISRTFSITHCSITGGGLYLGPSLQGKGLGSEAFRLFIQSLAKSGFGGFPYRTEIENPKLLHFIYQGLNGRINVTNLGLTQLFIKRFKQAVAPYSSAITGFSNNPAAGARKLLEFLINLFNQAASIDWKFLKVPTEGIIPSNPRQTAGTLDPRTSDNSMRDIFEDMLSSSKKLEQYIASGRILEIIPEWKDWESMYENENYRRVHPLSPKEHLLIIFKRLESDYFKKIADSFNFTPDDLKRLRRALFLHDFGKITVLKKDPTYKNNRQHPQASITMATKILLRLGYSLNEVEEDLILIRYHSTLADFARYGVSDIHPNQFIKVLKNIKIFNLLYLHQLVDAASVREKFENSLGIGLERRINEIKSLIEPILQSPSQNRPPLVKVLLRYLYDVKRQNKEISNAFNNLKRSLKKHDIKIDTRLLHIAYLTMNRSHRGQMRKDNKTPYAIHPIETAIILVEELGVRDSNCIIAALLHDVLEDTRTTQDALEEFFNKDIASIIVLLSKPQENLYPSKKDRDRDYLHRLIYGTNEIKDRNILTSAQTIKFADRIHSLRKLETKVPGFTEKIIQGTYEIFIPYFVGETEVQLQIKRKLIQELIESGKQHEKLSEGQIKMLQEFSDSIVEFKLPKRTTKWQPYTFIKALIQQLKDATPGKPVVLAFDGMSGAGKSTFANGLKTELEKEGKRVVIFDARDYLKLRSERDAVLRDVQKSGEPFIEQRELLFDFERFRKEVLDKIKEFRESNDAEARFSLSKLYNPETGEQDVNKDDVVNRDTVIIVEGMHVLQEDYLRYYDATFLIYVEWEVALKNVLERESRKTSEQRQEDEKIKYRFAKMDLPSYKRHWFEYWLGTGFVIDNTDPSKLTLRRNHCNLHPEKAPFVDEKYLNVYIKPKQNPRSSFTYPVCETDLPSLRKTDYAGRPIEINRTYLDAHRKTKDHLRRAMIDWLIELDNRSTSLDNFSGLSIQLVGGKFGYSCWRSENIIYIGIGLIYAFKEASDIPDLEEFALYELYKILVHEKHHYNGRIILPPITAFIEELQAVNKELLAVRIDENTRFIFDRDVETVRQTLRKGWEEIDRLIKIGWLPEFRDKTRIDDFNALAFAEGDINIAEAIINKDPRFSDIAEQVKRVIKKARGWDPFWDHKPEEELEYQITRVNHSQNHSRHHSRFTKEWMREQELRKLKPQQGTIAVTDKFLILVDDKNPKFKLFAKYNSTYSNTLYIKDEATGRELDILLLLFSSQEDNNRIGGMLGLEVPKGRIPKLSIDDYENYYQCIFETDETGTRLFLNRILDDGIKIRITELKINEKGQYVLDLREIRGNTFLDKFYGRRGAIPAKPDPNKYAIAKLTEYAEQTIQGSPFTEEETVQDIIRILIECIDNPKETTITKSLAWQLLLQFTPNTEIRGKIVYSLKALLDSDLNDGNYTPRLKNFVEKNRGKVLFYVENDALEASGYEFLKGNIITKKQVEGLKKSGAILVFMLSDEERRQLGLENLDYAQLTNNQINIPLTKNIKNDILLGFEIIRAEGDIKAISSPFMSLLIEAVRKYLNENGMPSTDKDVYKFLKINIPPPSDYSGEINNSIEHIKELIRSA